MPDLLDLAKARKELDSKDLLTIERETALTWGGRAAASYEGVLDDEDHAEQMRSFWEAETYRAEAVEHAAMTEDAGFLQTLLNEIEGHRTKARDHLIEAGHAFVEGNRTPKAHRGARPMTGKSPPAASAEQHASRAQRLAARAQPAPAAPAAAAPPPQAPNAAPATATDPPMAFQVVDEPPTAGRWRPGTTPGLGRRPGTVVDEPRT